MPTTETTRLNPYALTGIILAVVALAFLGIRTFTRDVVDVRASAATHQNLLTTTPTNGRVEPIEPFQAHAMAPGLVTKLYVQVGQKVKKGDPLIKMEDADAVSRLATANASLSTAQASLHDIE